MVLPEFILLACKLVGEALFKQINIILSHVIQCVLKMGVTIEIQTRKSGIYTLGQYSNSKTLFVETSSHFWGFVLEVKL